MDFRWTPGVPNEVTFVMVDANRNEVPGLTLSILIRTAGGSFQSALGSWNELTNGNGWYNYISTAGEAIVGPISIQVTAVGAVQQNLEYVCGSRYANSILFPYYVYESDGVTPITGVRVEVYNNSVGTGPAQFTGYTDGLGAARDSFGDFPWLVAGTWYFFRSKPGWEFDNPDVEVVS